MISARWWKAALALMLVALPAGAAELADVRWALPVFLRVLSLDSKYSEHVAGPTFVLLVPAPSSRAAERAEVVKAAQELKIGSVKGKPLKVVEAELTDKVALAKVIKDSQAAAIFLVPGLTRAEVKVVVEASVPLHTYTLAIKDDMIDDGVLLGVLARGEMRRVLLNSKAARELGVTFNDDVLKYVKTVP
jgi:hypothetical protein